MVAQLIQTVRAAMEELLAKKIADPRADFGAGAAAVVGAVVELISQEGGAFPDNR